MGDKLKEILLPGDKISDGILKIPGTYEKDGCTYASVIGMRDENDRFTPLENVYSPSRGDQTVGFVVGEKKRIGYIGEINLPYMAFISTKGFSSVRLRLGDAFVGKISRIDYSKEVDLEDVRRLKPGKIIDVPPSKVPRIIGKKGSMAELIKEKTGTNFVVGKNGYVWIDEKGNVPLVMKIINYIVKNAHKKGLTDKVSKMIEEGI